MLDHGRRGDVLTRRLFLARAGALAAAPATCAVLDRGALATAAPRVLPAELGLQPPRLPARQHAWDQTLARDAHGNPIPPRFDRLLFFEVNGRPTAAHARLLEAALRTLERRFHRGPTGLLFALGWGPSYFERVLGVASPIPQARALSDLELPVVDDHHLCLHLACDSEQRLAAVQSALLHGQPLAGEHGPLRVTDALRWRETRTGFIGAGLPAANQQVGGIPPDDPVPTDAPLFMGFKSGYRRNQASEDYVTIADGPFAEGTTMQVSYMRLRLDSWYGGLSQRERVARMYSPQTTPAEVARFTTDAPSNPGMIDEAIARHGLVGHSQASACARHRGRPLIIRRDFNTIDGGQAGLHFVSVQRSIDDFITTRNAMDCVGPYARDPAVAGAAGNGINEFTFVLKRGNYMVPPRAHRSFPLLRPPAA